MKQCDRTIARHRRAEMLEFVGRRCAFETLDDGHLPIAVGDAADDAAECAPVGQIAWLALDGKHPSPFSMFIEMIAVTWCAAGETGGERRRSALEIAAGALHAV